MNIFQMLGQLKQNPMAMLSKKYKLPQNMNFNNPNELIQYLLNTGQVNQEQVNRAMQMKDSPMVKQLLNNVP